MAGSTDAPLRPALEVRRALRPLERIASFRFAYVAIFLFLVHMIVRNVLGHSGYELLPRSLAHSVAWGWSNSVTHHDLHHETFRWNYGLYFTWWDRLMGTEHPQYRERLGGVRTAPALLLALLFVQGIAEFLKSAYAAVRGERL